MGPAGPWCEGTLAGVRNREAGAELPEMGTAQAPATLQKQMPRILSLVSLMLGKGNQVKGPGYGNERILENSSSK